MGHYDDEWSLPSLGTCRSKPSHREAAGGSPGASNCRPMTGPKAVHHPRKAAMTDKPCGQPPKLFHQRRFFCGKCGIGGFHGRIVGDVGRNGLLTELPAG